MQQRRDPLSVAIREVERWRFSGYMSPLPAATQAQLAVVEYGEERMTPLRQRLTPYQTDLIGERRRVEKKILRYLRTARLRLDADAVIHRIEDAVGRREGSFTTDIRKVISYAFRRTKAFNSTDHVIQRHNDEESLTIRSNYPDLVRKSIKDAVAKWFDDEGSL
jgi:hypothetical protein